MGKPPAIPVDINTFEIDADLLADLLASETATGSDLAKLLAQPASAATNEMRSGSYPSQASRPFRGGSQKSPSTSASFSPGSFYPDMKGPILRVYRSTFDVLPASCGTGTEVTLALVTTCSAPAKLADTTNLAVAFRARLLAGTGLLLLDSRRKQSELVEAALLVTVDRKARTAAGNSSAAAK